MVNDRMNDPSQISSANLAYLGDCVYELYVREYLVKKAFSTVYGARNLRRTIQRDLEDPISERIIVSFENPISSIEISVNNEEIVVNSK